MTALQVNPHAFVLRPFQVEDRAKTVEAFLDKDFTRLLGVWPTGSGKTVMFSELHLEDRMQTWLSNYAPNDQKILVVAHRDELIKQAVDKLSRSNPDLVIEVEQAGKRASPAADIIVASVPTLAASRGKRLKRFNPEHFRLIVIDEAHHAVSPSYLVIIQHFGFLPPPSFMLECRPQRHEGRQAILEWQRARLVAWDQLHKPDRLLLGVTATPTRGDRIGLEAVFQEIAFNRTIRQLMEWNYLCRLRAFRVETETSLDEVKLRAGDFAADQLAEVVNEQDRNAVAVRAYLDHGEGRKGVTFCVNVAHAMSLAKLYNEAGVTASAIHGGLADDRRAEMLDDFRAGRIQMLTNCQILCLDNETEILTLDGWKGPDHISPSDMVANWDFDGKIFFEEPKLIVRRPRFPDEAMVSYTSPRHNFRVTESHRMIVASPHSGQFQIKHASDIHGRTVKVPTSGLADPLPLITEQPEADFPSLATARKQSWALRQKDPSLSFNESMTQAVSRTLARECMRYKNPAELTLPECRFIGFWLADGTRGELSSGGVEYSCSQSMVYPDIIQWFDNVVSECNIDVARHEYPNRLNGVIKWSFSRGTGGGSQRRRGIFHLEPYLNKDGTSLLWGLSAAQFQALLEGFDAGDGIHDKSKRAGTYRITGTQLKLYELLQCIGACRGWTASIKALAEPSNPKHTQQYSFNIANTNTRILGAGKYAISKEDNWTDERVWCVTSTTGNIITRRNGCVTITGNTEGTDIPDIGVIVHARPTKSPLLYVQMTGRGLRIHPGKKDCIIIDIVDITRRHSLITSPELLGLPVKFDAKGGDLLEAKTNIEEAQASTPLADLSDIKSVDDIQLRVKEVDLLGQFHDETIDNHATMAWRKTGEGYELTWRGDLLSEAMEIVKTDTGWVAAHKRNLKSNRTAWEKKASTAKEALEAAEKYIAKNYGWVRNMLKTDSDWRNQPATHTQISNLKSFRCKVNFDTLSKGDATNLLAYYWAERAKQ
jgi:superfamily II DNA or RNA helicase